MKWTQKVWATKQWLPNLLSFLLSPQSVNLNSMETLYIEREQFNIILQVTFQSKAINVLIAQWLDGGFSSFPRDSGENEKSIN